MLTKLTGLLFNVNGGYLEGIVRGYRNTLLTGQNYSNVSTLPNYPMPNTDSRTAHTVRINRRCQTAARSCIWRCSFKPTAEPFHFSSSKQNNRETCIRLQISARAMHGVVDKVYGLSNLFLYDR